MNGTRPCERPRLPLLPVAVLLVFALPPPSALAALRPVSSGTLRLALPPPASDSLGVRDLATRIRASLTQCTLADLVDSRPLVLDGGRRLRLHLRTSLTFRDGRPLTSKDVVRSLEAQARPSGGAERWRLLVLDGALERLAGARVPLGLRAPDAHTLEIDLGEPIGEGVIDFLSHPLLPITSESGSTCGPFQRDPDPSLERYRPFEAHPKGRPFFDRVRVLPVGPGSAWKQADLRLEPGEDTPRRVELQTRRLTLLVVNGPRALRQAIERAIDREALVRFLVGGPSKPLTSLLGTSTREAPAAMEASPVPSLRLAYDGDDETARRVAERIQVRLHDAGLEVLLDPVTGGARGSLLTGAATLSLVTLPGVPSEPAEAIALLAEILLGPRQAFDALSLRFSTPGSDVSERLTTIADALPIVLLYETPEVVFVSDTLQGVVPGAALPFDPGDLWRTGAEGEATTAPTPP